MSDTNAEYERGKQEGLQHFRGTNTNWVRHTFGPLLWLGVPLAMSWWLLRRPLPGMGDLFPKAAKTGGKKKGSGNPMESWMEMMQPIQKREFRVDVKGTKFNDVIGIPEAKTDVQQYVDFLKEPNRFTRLGARLPRGCLLTGEPGTGKTLLAKAVAGEADVPFFSCSGADFIEVMGGSGPKRVRELFAEARETAPCIVFVDEIDAIGSRNSGSGGSISGEENRTINQLLAELDGLGTGEDPVIVLAATNFQDNIDKALLREGRFDRKVNIDMPDVAARREIFQFYLSRVVTGDAKGKLKNEKGEDIPADPSVSNEEIAKRLADLTPGSSPATCATIVNEAALQSAVTGKPKVEMAHLMDAIDNVLIGKKHRNRMGPEALDRTAIHECGHAMVAWMLPQQQKVLKLSVQPRGQALGFTQKSGSEYHEYQTNVTLFSDIAMAMGGRAAEDVILGNPSAGAMDDLQRATNIATQQLLAFGMSHSVGLLAYHPDETRKGRSFVHYSETTQALAEREAQKIVERAYAMAKEIVEKNRDKIEKLSKVLVEKKELTHEDIAEHWGERPKVPTTEDMSVILEETLAKKEATTNKEGGAAPAAAAATA